MSIETVKLKISWKEWDYCFNFSFFEVLDFVKDGCNVEILNFDPKNVEYFFCKCFLV